MTQVLRMEDAKGNGPFSAEPLMKAAHNNEQKAKEFQHEMWADVPWITVDEGALRGVDGAHPHHFSDVLHMDGFTASMMDSMGIMPLKGKWLVGVKDMDQFYYWFPQQSLKDFAKFGMKLNIYEVDEASIKRGKYQLMFRKTGAKLVHSYDLDQLQQEMAA